MHRTRQLFSLVLVITLALGWLPWGQPAALLAAPAAQGDGPVLVGEYRSDVLPAGDAPGLLVTLLLYDDGSAAVLSDYLNDADPIVEIGDWVANDDGTVTLTVVGTSEMDYAQPVSLTFLVDEEGALVVPGAVDGPFGEIGLRLAPVVYDGFELGELPDDATAYQSAILPAASGPGFQLTLVLVDDGSLALVSDYLAPDDYVIEIGDWTVDDDGTLLITLTGQTERDYDVPVELAFTEDEDGALILVDEDGALFGDEGLRLAPLAFEVEAPATESEEATAEEPAAEEAADEETAADEPAVDEPATEETAIDEPAADEPVAEDEETLEETAPGDELDDPAARGEGRAFSSLLLTDDEGAESFVVVVAYENGDAFVTTYPLDGNLPLLEVAAWEMDDVDESLIFTVLGTLVEAYTDPVTVTVQLLDDGALLWDDIALYPLAGLGPLTEAEAGETPALLAQFASDPRPAASSPGLLITLNLYGDMSAELISDYGDEEIVTEVGTWVAGEDETLVLTLTGQPDRDYLEPLELIFSVGSDDSLTLINDEDGMLYGESGLELFAVELDEEEAGLDDLAALPDIQIFRSEVLPSASSPGLQLTLGLVDGGQAILEYDYLNPGEVVTNFGTWEENADGNVVLTLDEGPSGPFADPDILTLELDADGNLVVVEVSETVFGLLEVVLSPATLDE